jgi:hypothetical protein
MSGIPGQPVAQGFSWPVINWPNSRLSASALTSAVRYDSDVRYRGTNGISISRTKTVLIDPLTGWVVNVIVADSDIDKQIGGLIPIDIPYGVAVDNSIVSGQGWKWDQNSGFITAPYP